MDWHRFYEREFDENVEDFLSFETRRVTSIVVEQQPRSDVEDEPELTRENHLDEQSLQSWLDRHNWAATQNHRQPRWSLKILLLRRAPPNAFEKAGEGSADRLQNLGCTQRQFLEIVARFGIAKSFTHCLLSNRSYYSRRIDSSVNAKDRRLDFVLRSNQAILKDMALCSTTVIRKTHTFVLIHGCSKSQMTDMIDWVGLMKSYGGHPALMPALFLELHTRRLTDRFEDLNDAYVRLDDQLFYSNSVKKITSDPEHYHAEVHKVIILNERLNTLFVEFVAFRPRISDVNGAIELIASECPLEQRSYIDQCGRFLMDRLQHLSRDCEYFQARTGILKDDTSMLVNSMWNTMAMNDNQISQQISAASKRDSSIMMGITVGTLTFLPGTAIATIFAMPMFNWNAPLGQSVTDHRFWIYLAVTLPITAFTLAALFMWMSLSDFASSRKLGVRTVLRSHLSKVWERLSLTISFKPKSFFSRSKPSPPEP